MEFKTHTINGIKLFEIISNDIIITTIQDGLDILGDCYYKGFEGILLHEKNITPLFFDLKTGIAGEILQKFSNYRLRLFVIGDFSTYTNKPLQDFIYESNKSKLVNFVKSVDDVLIAI